jgi:hypothetical protein
MGVILSVGYVVSGSSVYFAPICTGKNEPANMAGSRPLYAGVVGYYTPIYKRPRRDSNSQPTDSKSGALSIELRGQSARLYLRTAPNILLTRVGRILLSCNLMFEGVTDRRLFGQVVIVVDGAGQVSDQLISRLPDQLLGMV